MTDLSIALSAAAEASAAETADMIKRIQAIYVPAPLPGPLPDVTQAEFDALVASFNSLEVKQSADIVALSDLVKRVTAEGVADKLEDDKQSADIVALANRIASGGGSAMGVNRDNDILLDLLPGTDDEKLTAALAACQASSPRRAIRLTGRAHTFTQPRNTFSGLRILGPNIGWQNPEIGGTSGALPQCVVNLNITGSGFWLTGLATTYNVTIAGICFKSSNVSCFYQHSYNSGTSYATTMDTLSFYGFKHVLGTPADGFAMTLCTLKGSWTCVAVQDTQFTLRGSDNFLWVAGDMNYGWVGNNGGKYLVRFANLMKTSVKHMYLTARGGSRAVLVEGTPNQQGGLDISDCVFEGQNAGDPAMGALVVVKGGGVSFKNIKLNFGMANPSAFIDTRDTALVMVSGGIALFDTIWTGKATATPDTVPIFDVSGGICKVSNVFGIQPLGAAVKAKGSGGSLITDSTLIRI